MRSAGPGGMLLRVLALCVGTWLVLHSLAGTLRTGFRPPPATSGDRHRQEVQGPASGELPDRAELTRLAARLFVVGKPHAGAPAGRAWRDAVRKGVGGVLIARDNYAGDPAALWALTRDLKLTAGHPLAIFADQEGGNRGKYRHGQAFREGFTPLPRMGAIGVMFPNDTDLQRRVARRVAAVKFRELRAVNVDVNFDPIMDVNSNPSNPVIGDRAISGSVSAVCELGREMIAAMRV
eukprot:EG_transcript_9883